MTTTRCSCSVVVAAISVLGLVLSATAANLVPDPEFKQVDFESPHYQRYVENNFTWIRHQIQMPSESSKDGASVKLDGGITFLHSSRFDVQPGREYTAAVEAKGNGKLRLEFLWFGDNIEQRRSVALDGVDVGGTAREFSGKAVAPEGAQQAFLRIVAEEGSVTVAKPSVK